MSFLLRRIAIIYALLMTTHLWLQIMIAFAQEIIVLIILGWMNPYAENGKWKREILNEWFIILTIYHVICFTEGNSVTMRTFMGYSFCFFLSLHVMYNILFIMSMALKSSFAAWKKSIIVKRELKKADNIRNSKASKTRNVEMIVKYRRQRGRGKRRVEHKKDSKSQSA